MEEALNSQNSQVHKIQLNQHFQDSTLLRSLFLCHSQVRVLILGGCFIDGGEGGGFGGYERLMHDCWQGQRPDGCGNASG